MRAAYEHTQVGRWTRRALLTAAVAVLAMTVVTPVAGREADRIMMITVALVLAGAGLVFGSLTVRFEQRDRVVAFGSGWPRRRVPLDRIARAEATRTRWYEGWGIRLTTRGWLWNVSGLDAVLLTLRDGKRLLIGTDPPDRLLNAINAATSTARGDP